MLINSKKGAYYVNHMKTFKYKQVPLSIYSRIKEMGNRLNSK